jgi:hypothetical protein
MFHALRRQPFVPTLNPGSVPVVHGLGRRFVAAGIHLGCCAVIAITLVVVITQFWYPAPLFDLAKGRDIFLILIACDITLGPLLTLIIFNVRKPRRELVRDVAIIASVQIAAMIYGVSTLFSARPVFIVYNVGQFNVSLANEITNGDSSTTEGPFSASSLPWFGPKLVGARLPTDADENNRLIFSSVSGRGDVFQIPRYFVTYDEVKSDVAARSRSVADISKKLHIDASRIHQATSSYEKRGVAFGLLPLVIRTTTALAVVDSKSGELLGIEAIPSDL